MAIYCASCGKASVDDARFCASCGHAFSQDAAGYTPVNPSSGFAARPLKSLVRPRVGRKVAGVCQGIANLYGWDVIVVRIVMLILAIAAFPIGLVIYGIVWLVAPEEALALPASTYVGNNP
jgi:phage shock protein C